MFNKIALSTAALATLTTLTTVASLILSTSAAHAQVQLGTFTFNSQQFGNSVVASDGGSSQQNAWLNTVNAAPTLTSSLTGSNFNTGIANIGSSTSYTISYSAPITNGAGNDFGIVVGYDTPAGAPVSIAISTDGSTFTSAQTFSSGAVSTGVQRAYYYSGYSDTYTTTLSVIPVNLDIFGVGSGSSVQAIRVTGGGSGADVIRVAGFGAAVVPEANTAALLGLALPMIGAVAVVRRRIKKA